jgi:WD40 repeat protein
MKTHEMLSC